MLRFAMLACLVSAGAAYAAGSAFANERSAELVSSFQMFCTPGPPDFATLEAKATAMNLPVRKDVVAPPGQSARTKSWLVSLASGSHEFVVSDGKGPKGEALSCGIGAEDVDGEEIRQELIKAMKLGAPLRQTASADGTQRVTAWKYADDVTLLLADATPMKIPGIYLALLHQTNTSR